MLVVVHQQDAGLGVFADVFRDRGCEVDAWTWSESGPPTRDLRCYDGVMILGGAMHPDQQEEHPWLAQEKALLRDLVERRVPIFAVCLGAQLLAEAGGAPTRRCHPPEIGWYDAELTCDATADPVFGSLEPRFEALQWHNYEFDLPGGATPLAWSSICLQAYRLGESAWGVQFHPEVTLDDYEAWIDQSEQDGDGADPGLERELLRIRTREAIDSWNELGRGLCHRFLNVVATHRP